MKLDNEFTVSAPLERTWETLLDIERVAACLPGARIEPGGEDGVYRGSMKLKLGPMTLDYRGTARLADVDEDTHVASIAVTARDAKGQGTAAAVIRNRLERAGEGTRVVAETDLKVTGRQAQFGRAIMEDVAGTMMKEFASALERELQAPTTAKATATASAKTAETAQTAQTAAAPPRAASAPEDDALDLGNVLAQTPMVRYAGAAGVVVVVLLALFKVLGGRRGHITLNINLNR